MTLTLTDRAGTTATLRSWLGVVHPHERPDVLDIAARELVARIAAGQPHDVVTAGKAVHYARAFVARMPAWLAQQR